MVPSTSTLAAPSMRGDELPADTRGPNLRRLLVALDAAALTVAWTGAWLVPWAHDTAAVGSRGLLLRPLAVVAIVATTLLAMAAMRLYRARVCSIRAVEVLRIGRAAIASVLAAVTVDYLFALEIQHLQLWAGGIATFLLVAFARGLYRSWLKAVRRQGRYSRPVLVIGLNEDGQDLVRSLQQHPELGFLVCGVVGEPVSGAEDALDLDWLERSPDVSWLGTTDDALDAVRRTGANGVFVAASALSPSRLNRLVRVLQREGVHIHLSSGLQGVGHRRLRPHHLAFDTVFYLEPAELQRWQVLCKRVLDVVLSSFGLLIAAPFLLLAAIAVKIQDGEAVLFKQKRIGLRGEPFVLYKVRTMVPDAEQRLDAVREMHQRREGPLFKAARDPRVTPVGRFLRATSIDELPQLWNVLLGTMSLVGPRPALPDEVAQFDSRLRLREQVPPGITGLWQVEARDNPSFRAYERFDLFYVENWSVGLDMAILGATTGAVLARSFRAMLAPLRRPSMAAHAHDLLS